MKKIKLFSLLSLLSTFSFSQTISDGIEPPLKIELTINGKVYSVADGDTVSTDKEVIKVQTTDNKTFDHGRLSFDYPKEFAFAFEEEDSYKNWTLDGNNFVISYFLLDVEVGVDAYVEEMTKKFGKKNCKVTDKEIKLGQVSLKGKRILVELVGTKLTYDLYSVSMDDSKTHLFALQDTKDDNGGDSKESKKTMSVLRATFKVK